MSNKKLIGGRDPEQTTESISNDELEEQRFQNQRNIDEGRRILERRANVASLNRRIGRQGTRRQGLVSPPNNRERRRSPERRRSARRRQERAMIEDEINHRNIRHGDRLRYQRHSQQRRRSRPHSAGCRRCSVRSSKNKFLRGGKNKK